MQLADLALNNAINIEVTKAGMSQRATGDWQLRLSVAPGEMDERLMRAAVGARFACVLVEVEDSDVKPAAAKTETHSKWSELDAVKQAAMRCKEPVFWAFLSDEMFNEAVLISSEESAARVVREHCGVTSRADLAKPGEGSARDLWHRLDQRYQAWRAKEHV